MPAKIGVKVGGQPLPPFQSVDVQDGEIIELANGKRYTVKYAGEPRISHTLSCTSQKKSLVLSH